MERRGVLMIANLVLLGLFGSGIYGLYSGFARPTMMITVLAVKLLLIVLFTSSYVISGINLTSSTQCCNAFREGKRASSHVRLRYVL